MRADRSGMIAGGAPLAIVNARTIEQVQATMRFATEHGIPVVPRGSGTGLAGGAIGAEGEIVLSTRAMNAILEVSPADQIVVVQPGILNGDLNDAMAEHGLWFAADPSSRRISTVGGNIATNAGGLLGAKYGVTREAVLGLTLVLADGSLLRTGRRTVKGVTGLDLTALFVGSEGILGIVVEAVLRLLPIPVGEPAMVGASFPDVVAGARAASAITAARIRPSIMELIDGPSLAAMDDYLDTHYRDLGSGYLIVQTDGADALAEAERVSAIIAEHGGAPQLQATREDGEKLLHMRRSMNPAVDVLGEVLVEDVAVPRSRLGDMFEAIQEISDRYGIVMPTVAHAADGNLHPCFVFESADPASEVPVVPEHIWRAADELFETALRFGGTLTGEHGVGLLKKKWLERELGSENLELQRNLKRLLDPKGILNPGKLFDL
jgi:glycolate oxidase